jgi:hypothetical protein
LAISAATVAAQLAQRAPLEDGVEEIRGRTHGRWREAGGGREDAVLHVAVRGHEHHQRAVGARETNSTCLTAAVVLGVSTKLAPVRQAREHVARAVEYVREVGRVAAERALDLGALGAGDVADLQDAVHEQAQAELGGDAAGADVRGCRAGPGARGPA